MENTTGSIYGTLKIVSPVITTYEVVVLEDAERERLITAIVERVTAKILAELAGKKKRKMETRGPTC